MPVNCHVPELGIIIVFKIAGKLSPAIMNNYKLAVAAVNTGNFVGVSLKQASAKTAKEINKQQFYQALADCISVRLMPDS